MAALSATAIFAPRTVYAEERQEDYSVRAAVYFLCQMFVEEEKKEIAGCTRDSLY